MKEFEYEKLIRENLETLDDVELIFLKGHLVIEQLLTELLEHSTKEPERINTMNLMFNKKLEIYLAINGNDIINEGLEILLKNMNSLRNKLAHNLNHPDFDTKLVEWVEIAKNERISDSTNSVRVKEQLIEGISYISAFLTGAIHARKSYNKLIKKDV